MSGLILLAKTIFPKYVTPDLQNDNFSKFIEALAFCRISNTFLKCVLCSFILEDEINTSSKSTLTYVDVENRSLIHRLNSLGALDMPKGLRRNSQCFYKKTKAVL